MSEPKNWWFAAGVIAALVLTFYAGYGYGVGGQYSLDIYQTNVSTDATSTQWHFPLETYSLLHKINCDPQVNKVTLAVTLKGRFSDPKPLRAQTFCGLIYLRSDDLRPSLFGN